MGNSIDKNTEEIVQLQKDFHGCLNREESLGCSGKEAR